MAEKKEDKKILVMAPVEFGAPGRLKSGIAKWLAVGLMVCAVTITYFFAFSVIPFGFPVDSHVFAYFSLAFVVPCVLLNVPLRKGGMGRIPWWDWVLAAIAFGTFIFFGINYWDIAYGGWASYAPIGVVVLATITVLLLLFLAYRLYGLAFFIVIILFTSFPMWASKAPGILFGISITFRQAMTQFAMGGEGVNGIPLRFAGPLVVSFTAFVIPMLYMGGGRTLINLAFAIVGGFRGGGAKAAVIGSAAFASLSGGGTTNAIVTGTVTIPAMKRSGYPPVYAGAIEACSSMGGTLTPPIMGSAAFIMAAFLLTEYWLIAAAAAIPAILFYVSLFSQVDLYAKKVDLKGFAPGEIPSVKETLKEGWIFLVAMGYFVLCLVYFQLGMQSGFYSVAALLVLYFIVDPLIKAFISRTPEGWQKLWQRLRGFPRDLANIILSLAKVTASVITLFGIIGLIIAGLTLPGVALSLGGGIINVAGGNIWLLLLLGAFAAFIMGMAVTVSAVYVLVAILLAPGLIEAGLNPVAAHLFVLYWGMMSGITPPVALVALMTARIADADFFKTAFTACAIGISLFILPFFFVMSPALVLQEASAAKIAQDFITCALGLVLLSSGIQGILYFIKGTIGIPMRFLILLSGLLLAAPQAVPKVTTWLASLPPFGQWVALWSDYLGAGLAVVAIVLYLLWRRVRRASNPELQPA
ncbi:TRAP transporter permease [Chloroflexota bacterium]